MLSHLFPHRSLIVRLRRALLALAVLPLLLGFGISLVGYVSSERSQLHDQYQHRATRASNEIRQFLAQAEDHLAQAQRFWSYDQLAPAQQQRILRDIMAGNEAFVAIDYLNPQGERRLRVSRREFGEQPGRHWREQEAVVQTMAAEQKNYSRVKIDPSTGEPSLIFTLPVHDPQSGRMAGMLVAELSLKRLWQTLMQLSQGTDDDLFVLSAEQRVIAHVNPSQVLAGTRYAPPAAVGVHRDLAGGLALVAAEQLHLPGNTLTAVLTRPLSSAYQGALFQFGVALVILLAALALAWGLLRLVGRWLLDPIVELTEAARRIGAEEKDVRVQGRFEGEMATLADTFNLMLDRLRQDQLALEQRVIDRTQALSAANEQAFQANRMLYTVLDTIPVRIFWKDRNLVYLGCNRLFAQDAGKTGTEEIIGRTDHDLSWQAVAGLYRSDDQQVIDSGQARLGYEEPQTTADGKTLWLRTSKVPLRDAAGEIIGVLGTYEDITEAKQIESELRSAKEAAEAANRSKSLFLSSMSHELRTPLNAILGYSQLLEMNAELTPEVTESAGEIRQAGQHLLALVNDILDLARVESGHLEFHLEGLTLGTVLADCLSQNQSRAAENGIALLTGAACQNQPVFGDRRRLVQVLNNLVSNAIKYNRKGGQVGLACHQSAPGWCRIEVSDTGAGLTAAQLSQLFQPFNRAGAEMSQIEGTGIGLTITKQLVEGMGGTIGVHSTPGQGSTFWVELREFEAASQAPASPLAPAATAPGRPRVLVAEDYGPNQTVLRLQLESLGCEVVMAGDGAAALVCWRQQRPSLILTDLNMPVMDGLALARAVRQMERETGGHTPIVAITAAAESSELKRCHDAGMDDALTKPIALEGLRAVLARWAGGAGQAQPAADAAPTPAEAQSPAVFDLTALYRVLGQVNPMQARELVDAFIASAGAGLAALAQQPADEQALAREMHKQKSSARTVGALHYARLAEALECSASVPGLDAPGRLAELAQALAAVRQATQRLEMPEAGAAGAAGAAPAPPEVLPQVQCSSVLVVDDDVVVLKQMQPMLSSLGVAEVLTVANGMEAIATLSARATELEVVVCDLNMPEMDGVELIRRFGQTGFKGALILMSGAELQILNTARQLAEMQGLRVLGLINKPVMPRDMVALLARAREQAPVKRGGGPARPAAQISVQEVREAMARGEFTVWFQPKVDTLSLQPTGLEALARWRRADGSFVPPDQFILLAEREGLIGELSHVLVAAALREAARVHQAGFALKLAVNLSGLWLDDLNLPDIILTMAREAGIQPRDLVLEVTETGVMEDLTTALDVLTRLRLKGFGLSIDDFGIGYSSFEQLGRIPFTEMKLDRSFVNKGQQDPAARAILESSMGMAQKLGLVTVAEGVETPGELALVRELGCDNVQGYLVAKPMPVDALLTWLAQPTAVL